MRLETLHHASFSLTVCFSCDFLDLSNKTGQVNILQVLFTQPQ